MLKQENITRICCGAYRENAFLVCPEGTANAFIVDPGDDVQALRRALETMGRHLAGILLTHGHFDHMLAAQPLQELTGAPIYVSHEDTELLLDAEKCAYDPSVCREAMPDDPELIEYGDTLTLCGITLKILKTPGHTRGSVCLYDEASGILFAGDTLFLGGYGRYDLYGGDSRALVKSLRMLFELPQETFVLTGHGDPTTIGNERARYSL